jgi:AraC-like DNA-binding protein
MAAHQHPLVNDDNLSTAARDISWRTKHVLELIHHEKGNIQLSLKVLSTRVGVSKEHLGRAFQADMGLPFRVYMRMIRISEARQLLGNVALSIKQIAHILGYSETANFVRDFRSCTHMSPLQYRNVRDTAPTSLIGEVRGEHRCDRSTGNSR